MSKCVFLDRDGTINFDYSHVFDPDRLALLPHVARAISKFNQNNFKVIIITNQSCLGRGLATWDQVDATNQKLLTLLLKEEQDAHIHKIYICPDHPDRKTNRRKPQPGMIMEAVKEFDIDLNKSWIIGDKPSDPECGLNAGIPQNHCLLVRPNQTEDFETGAIEFNKFDSLIDIVSLIID